MTDQWEKAVEAAVRAGALANGDDYMEDFDRHWTFANAFVAALDSHGYCIVPKEPTPEMLGAGRLVSLGTNDGGDKSNGYLLSTASVGKRYRAMLSAFLMGQSGKKG